MARERLSWDKEKKAEQEKKADPYQMNQDHPNPPASKYDIGGPSEFAEDPDMKTPWKNEGRVETGHPAPARAREAVKAARQLEDKALKCITIAQRILPGASDNIIEEQATDFMYLPDKSILATLQRQAKLAEVLAKDDEDEDEENGKEAKKEEKVPVENGDEEENGKEAKKEEKVPAENGDEEENGKEAKKEEKVPAENGDEEENGKEAKKEEKVPAENGDEEENGDKAAKKEEPKKEATTAELDIELSSNSGDLLDSLFATEEKVGAKKLSGIVKKASTVNQLDGIWNAPPDISKAFDLK